MSKKSTNFNGILDVLRNFPDEKACREYFEKLRWQDGKIVCQKCGSNEKIYKIRDGKLYCCAKCRKQFTIKVGTVFEDSPLPLQTWFMALYLITAHKKGISSLQLSRDLNLTQRTAWFVLHRLRYAVKTKSFNKPLEGIVQIDETFVGGRAANKHKARLRSTDRNGKPLFHAAQGRSSEDKTPVVGLVQQGGEIRAQAVPDTKSVTLKPIIKSNVKEGATIVTDEYRTYNTLSRDYIHETIMHRGGEYVRDGFHTNTIEGFWAWLKRSIFGIYHNVSREHLQAYVDETTFKYNSRKLTDTDRFDKSLSLLEGRLTYKQLIQK